MEEAEPPRHYIDLSRDDDEEREEKVHEPRRVSRPSVGEPSRKIKLYDRLERIGGRRGEGPTYADPSRSCRGFGWAEEIEHQGSGGIVTRRIRRMLKLNRADFDKGTYVHGTCP